MSAATSGMKNSKGWQFQRKKVNRNDITDLPFSIHGIQLRWISARKNENRHMAGVWKVLRKDELAPELLKDLTRDYIGMFDHGDTIRNGDLVLAYAPIKHAKERREELRQAADDQLARVFRAPKEEAQGGQLQINRKETSIGDVGPESFEK